MWTEEGHVHSLKEEINAREDSRRLLPKRFLSLWCSLNETPPVIPR